MLMNLTLDTLTLPESVICFCAVDFWMKYFAYGSNMCTSRLRSRVTSATFYCVARLPGYRLRFHKRGQDESGKCNAFRTDRPQDEVLGIVFEIDPVDKPNLDNAEGLGNGYHEETVRLIYDQGDLEAYVYIADKTHIEDNLLPYTWYKEFVVGGALEHGLPDSYVEMLIQVKAINDSKPGRAAQERRLLPCGQRSHGA